VFNFEVELDRLLRGETTPLPDSELAELTQTGIQQLQQLTKRQTDLSMQLEEIYDFVSREPELDVLQQALRDEKVHTGSFVRTVVGLSDLIDDFCAFAQYSENEALEHQARLMQKKVVDLLECCAITRLGEDGQLLDPKVHAVQSAVMSSVAREHVVQVLQSGYRYQGVVFRRAAVVVSLGPEPSESAAEVCPVDDRGISGRQSGGSALGAPGYRAEAAECASQDSCLEPGKPDFVFYLLRERNKTNESDRRN